MCSWDTEVTVNDMSNKQEVQCRHATWMNVAHTTHAQWVGSLSNKMAGIRGCRVLDDENYGTYRRQ